MIPILDGADDLKYGYQVFTTNSIFSVQKGITSDHLFDVASANRHQPNIKQTLVRQFPILTP